MFEKVCKISSLAFAALVFIGFYGVFGDWGVDDFDDRFFTFEFVAFDLVVFCGDGSGVVIRNESRVAELIGKRFGSADKIVEVLKFGTTSLNEEANAMAAFFLCLWRFDQWDERIVLRDGVR